MTEHGFLKVVSALLALLLLVSFFLFPWLRADPVGNLPGLLQTGIDALLPALERIAPPPVPAVIDSLRDASSLTPLELLGESFTPTWLRLVILAPLIAALIALMATGLALMGKDEIAQILFVVAAFAAGLTALGMVFVMPALLRLTLSRGAVANLALALFNIRLGFGFWVTWAVVLGLAVVNALLAVSSKPKPRPAYTYSPRRY